MDTFPKKGNEYSVYRDFASTTMVALVTSPTRQAEYQPETAIHNTVQCGLSVKIANTLWLIAKKLNESTMQKIEVQSSNLPWPIGWSMNCMRIEGSNPLGYFTFFSKFART